MRKLLSFLSLYISLLSFSQTELVFVYFKDKPNAQTYIANPSLELSAKAILRRQNLGIAIDEKDAPIEPTYIQNIQNLGYTVTDKSKWLNGVAVNATPAQINDLKNLSYVKEVESFVKNTVSSGRGRTSKIEKFQNTATDFTYGNSLAQIEQINLRSLHVNGFTGAGIDIAVIDTGFPTVNTGSAFARVRNNGQIKDGYNFINKSTDIYNTSLNSHGTNCFSIIGGYIEGVFVGSAPDANFYLYATENTSVEIPEEELYWIEAAEEADRKGVDIISTSLGYNTFDDARYNYTYNNMNGQKSFIARGVNIASNKGIIVMVANGNEANKTWHYLITPADSEKAFSIGSVTSTGTASSFSSFGPNANNTVKPDAAARGTSTYYAYNDSSGFGNGTSYATPLSAGGVACLLQAIPQSTNRETIKNKLRETASLYPNSDPQIGYGILNFGNALNSFLSASDVYLENSVKIFPVPASKEINIEGIKNTKSISIYNSLGQLIKNENGNFKKINIESLTKGIYYLKINIENSTVIKKFIKE